MTTRNADLLDRTGARKLLKRARKLARQVGPNRHLIIEEIDDRRGYGRKQCSSPISLVEITKNNAPGLAMPATVLNVSKRGLCVLVDEPLAKGSLVTLDLSGRQAEVGRTLLAHVMRIQRARGQAGYVLGLKRHVA